ncbi:unnamed protein product [Diatraea saccharalis]|uniref:DNA polymerase V n=1 Tax=Diatraea saccharalis TaxID=40085 RepID=A0A9N9R8H8_9NEOP|nr:unnamed protein product [Diatraea saccharalis]
MEIKLLDNGDTDSKKADRSITSSILEAFDLLKAAKDDDKITGGARIIIQLLRDEDNKDEKYALKRLVRSLGANIPDMRTGYFATLVTVITKIKSITIAQLLDLVRKELHANNSSKSEVGDVALGQILVCSAIFRSGLMIKSTEDEQKEVLNLLLSASKKKSYLSTVAFLILMDFVNLLNEDEFTSIVWSNLKQEFKKDIKDHNLDSLFFLLIICKKFPNKVKLRKLIGVSEVICDDTLQDISEKLMAGIDYNSVNHPIYEVIGEQMANSPHLQQFWISGIDSQLSKHNRNRELVTLNIFKAILSNLRDNINVLPELISTNFFKLFMDWFKGLQTVSKIRNKRDDEDDHKIMIKKEKEILMILAKAMKFDNVDNKIRVEVLNKLLLNPGEINFTEITGTSLIKSIIADLDKDGVKKMAKKFKGILLNTTKKYVKEDVERNWYNNERLKAAELISFLVIHEAVKDDTDFKLNYMKLLMCFGFFKIGSDESVAISKDLAGAIKACFYRCFTSKFTNVDSLVFVLSSLCNFITSSLDKEQIRMKIEKQFPKESMECWELLSGVTENIENKESKSKVDKVFLVLLYQLGLFLFSEPIHVKVARSSIKELKSCYDHYRKENKKKNKVKDPELSDEPEWIEVLIEVLLSILSIESSVLRSVVQCVFRLLWEFLTPTAVGQIVSVLDPENESNPLANESDSENDSESESDNEQNEDTKKKILDDSSESEDEDDDEMKTPEQLRMAVQKALGSAATESDAESVDADLIDDEEADKLDEALAEAFKQFGQSKGKNNKKDRKDKKNLSDFRIRVLDLLIIYLEKDPSMDICLSMIAPLMRCLEFCIQDNQFKELENRVRKTIKVLTKVRKFSSTEGITLEILCDYLKSTIDKGARSQFLFQAVGDVITFFATFIVHCSIKIDNNTTKSKKKHVIPIAEALKDSLHNYFVNRNCLLPIIFFHSILQMEWEGNFILMPIIIEHVFNNQVRQFRRNEGLDLMVGFYRALNRNKPTNIAILSKLSNLEETFEKTIKNNFHKETNFEVKHNFIVLLKKLINTMKSFHESCHIKTNLDFQSLLDIIGSYKCTTKGKQNNMKNEGGNESNKTRSNKKRRKLDQMNGHSELQKKRLRKDSVNGER